MRRQGDARLGKDLFVKACSHCHSLQEEVHPSSPRLRGPHLSGLVGRRAGAIRGFPYSQDMRSSHLVWEARTLLQFLRNPNDVFAGTKAPYVHMKKSPDREDIVAFLQVATDPTRKCKDLKSPQILPREARTSGCQRTFQEMQEPQQPSQHNGGMYQLSSNKPKTPANVEVLEQT
uniref:Cytochrome c domain-containing protein n=1 Tax=Timema shepardi TaxID=629360 RepID=A0A7R9B682_TIMSH|nr:unnamed protein product [Timema shepardi]